MITCRMCERAIRGNAGAEEYDEAAQVMRYTCRRCAALSRVHVLRWCKRTQAPALYAGNGWRAKFECPACGRNAYQGLNFLGSRALMCDGLKFSYLADRDQARVLEEEAKQKEEVSN